MSDPLTRVPELVQGMDVRTLPLSALEGFVLSRIDGRAPVREIVAVTGLPADQVQQMLDRLLSLGAMRWKGEAAVPAGMPAKPPVPPQAKAPPAPQVRTPVVETQAAAPSPVPGSRAEAPASTMGSRAEAPASTRHNVGSGEYRPVRPSSSGTHQPISESPISRRKSGTHQPVRRIMSEAGISQPPPDMRRTTGQAPAVPSTPAPVGATPATPATAPEPASTAALYDPSELDEACELPRERRKQVLDLFYRLRDLDFYEALDIPYDADKKEIRSAYFALSKSFHPDTMFRKELGSFKAKMEAVFKYLTEAYDTLSKKKARDEYDAYLRSTKATQMAERDLAMAARESAETQRALQVEVPPPPPLPGAFGATREAVVAPAPTPAPAPASPANAPAATRETPDEARKLAQEVIARRLRAAMPQSSSIPAREAAQRPEPTRASSDRTPSQEILQQLGRALKGASSVTGGVPVDPLPQLVEASKQALARGELQEATQLMRRALSVAPERPDLRAEYDKLSKQLSQKLADEYAVQAQFESKQGKWGAAAVAWAKVCEGRPQDANAHRETAFALFKVGGDLRGAQKYGQQAAFLAPNDVNTRVLLAQIYLTLGLKLNAKRELEAARKLDPGNEIVKNLLSDLKG